MSEADLKDNNQLSEKEPVREKWKDLALVIGVPLTIIVIFVNLLVFSDKITPFLGIVTNSNNDTIKLIINILNILTAYIFGVLIYRNNVTDDDYNIIKEKDFLELAEEDFEENNGKIIPVKSPTLIKEYQEKVNELVKQYKTFVVLFSVSLIFIYTCIILYSAVPVSKEVNRQVNHFTILTNILDLLGGLFLYLGFAVLYKTTTRKSKNSTEYKTDKGFLMLPISLTCFYILIFILLAFSFYMKGTGFTLNGANLDNFNFINLFDFLKASNNGGRISTVFLNLSDLLVGSVAGLAFTLLFGRYLAVEFALRNTKLFEDAFSDIFSKLPFFKKSYKNVISFSIIFLLPVYALAQPLFGSLKIDAFGSSDILETSVYGICLVGKFIFFWLTYLIIKNRLLHLYLYGLVAEIGNFEKLEECLGEKAKSSNILEVLYADGFIVHKPRFAKYLNNPEIENNDIDSFDPIDITGLLLLKNAIEERKK